MRRIGLISDTHGLLRQSALDFLAGCELIVHAGDICDANVLERLQVIAPVVAVRGNNDRGSWADELSRSERLTIDDIAIHVVHDLADLDIEPHAERVKVVVSGHSHHPAIDDRDGVLFVNPGSAGPRRFSQPISIGELEIDGDVVRASLRTLAVD